MSEQLNALFYREIVYIVIQGDYIKQLRVLVISHIFNHYFYAIFQTSLMNIAAGYFRHLEEGLRSGLVMTYNMAYHSTKLGTGSHFPFNLKSTRTLHMECLHIVVLRDHR